MNERIKQLAEQAMVTNNRGDGYYNRILDPEKFAELIVRECVEQVWYTREDYINENISEVIKERMKQHFGVDQ